MRIRRKKRLSERMLNGNKVVAVADRDVINVKVAVQDKRYFDYVELFGNDNVIEMDIGCGKGAFICEMAKSFPNKNFFAVEMIENIIIEGVEKAVKDDIKNLKFINTGAEYLPRYIKDNTISKIYLNFSPPYPQSSYENRRLTNDKFIKVYKQLLVDGGMIEQKTDDKGFFDYSVESFRKNGFEVYVLTEEYSSGKIVDNILTEFEAKYRALNQSVYMLRAIYKQ